MSKKDVRAAAKAGDTGKANDGTARKGAASDPTKPTETARKDGQQGGPRAPGTAGGAGTHRAAPTPGGNK